MRLLYYYFVIWRFYLTRIMQVDLAAGWAGVLFLLAKLFRMAFFYLVIHQIFQSLDSLAGYDVQQATVIYFTFLLLNTLSQFLFRGVYHFRGYILAGELDLLLLRPVNILFQAMMMHPDVYDLITLMPLLFWGRHLLADLAWPNYLLMCLIALLWLAAWHVFSLSWSLHTQSISPIVVFRSLFKLARYPVSVYPQFLQRLLTYVVPVWFIVMLPARSAWGAVSLGQMLINLLLASMIFGLAVVLFFFSLRFYHSASS